MKKPSLLVLAVAFAAALMILITFTFVHFFVHSTGPFMTPAMALDIDELSDQDELVLDLVGIIWNDVRYDEVKVFVYCPDGSVGNWTFTESDFAGGIATHEDIIQGYDLSISDASQGDHRFTLSSGDTLSLKARNGTFCQGTWFVSFGYVKSGGTMGSVSATYPWE
jgi:hypothetical protein